MLAADRFFLSVNRLPVQCLKAKALGHGSGIIFRNFTLSQITIALPAILKAVNGILTSLSGEKEIKVVFAGTPCTDGKTVYLGEPLLQSQDALDAYLSHGTHEIHHVLYSEEDCIRSLMLWKTFALMPSDIKNIRAAIFGAMNTFLRWLGQGSFRISANILRRARFFALLAIGA